MEERRKHFERQVNHHDAILVEDGISHTLFIRSTDEFELWDALSGGNSERYGWEEVVSSEELVDELLHLDNLASMTYFDINKDA